MTGFPRHKACYACAKAKRRCGKQSPHCLRCQRRGVRCEYPPVEPGRFVLLDDNSNQTTQNGTPILNFASLASTVPSPATPQLTNLEIYPTPPAVLDNYFSFPDDPLPSSWFTSSQTWKTKHPPTPNRSASTIRRLKRHIHTIKSWLAEWVETGSNHFIHPCLYKARFPSSIRDAYTDLACYNNRTPANEDTVLQIIEDRVENLLAAGHATLTLDPLERLARVQALLIYQIIGLFDGDIRLRHLSQGRIPVLCQWMREMVDGARQAPCLGAYICSADKVPLPSDPDHPDLLWYSWILAESIRRTFIISSGVQGVFIMMQAGKTMRCQGGMMFTTRKGVWEAPSALAWEKICAEVNVGLIQTAELDNLLLEVELEHLNDFTKAILQVTMGRDF